MKTRHKLTYLGPAALMIIALAGCAPSSTQGTAAPSLVAAPSATAVPAPSVSEDPNTPADWGPLAIVPAEEGMDTALAQGTLRITETCVLLESTAGTTFVYWPADRAHWVPETRSIRFDNADGTVFTAEDGASVSVGGSGDGVAEGGPAGEDWIKSKTWVVPPDSSCPLDRRWGVGHFEKAS